LSYSHHLRLSYLSRRAWQEQPAVGLAAAASRGRLCYRTPDAAAVRRFAERSEFAPDISWQMYLSGGTLQVVARRSACAL